MDEVFYPVPITIDPSTKTMTTTDTTLVDEIAELNKTYRQILQLETRNQIPGPPTPVHQKRSVQVNKMREAGNTHYKRGAYSEAIKMYDLAIRMASERPPWEASGLVREELSTLYNNRSQAWMSQQLWAEALVDAETSVEMKRVGNVKAWWRRGQCLKEMGRLREAKEVVSNGIELEKMSQERTALGELETLLKEISKALEN